MSHGHCHVVFVFVFKALVIHIPHCHTSVDDLNCRPLSRIMKYVYRPDARFQLAGRAMQQ